MREGAERGDRRASSARGTGAVFVCNVHSSVGPGNVRKLFSCFGEVAAVSCAGSGAYIVAYRAAGAASDAVKHMDGFRLMNRRLSVRRHRDGSARGGAGGSRSIIIGNMHAPGIGADSEFLLRDLEHELLRFGVVTSICPGAALSGSVVVGFQNAHQAQMAADALDGRYYAGRQLSCRLHER